MAVWPKDSSEAQTVSKGDIVTVAGRLKQYEFRDAKGEARRGYEIIAKTVDVSKPQKPITPNLHGITATDGDIPF